MVNIDNVEEGSDIVVCIILILLGTILSYPLEVSLDVSNSSKLG